ncbi:extracellular catalytic domain type 1 short-chain-length polyhydroxyalkanoate depolymerase [Streptomyces poriferorum]|uniref:PHB depolymerase family esterase n=1 Tax=Streptomyces poriferorum TaxID=2798799 RepID=A0ABY9IZ34_9ACTN|nr:MULTISPECIES: PHB depolymerase family esterase [unclassified Streptomyces]MDP5311672.1 PHB depolymerase family esterase [Streptomyces sp. Alt4]WLQ59247.1 PHB depolymerase family esterase [Streptomyces sp. Alt2]
MRPSILRRLLRRVASTAVLGLLAATLGTTAAATPAAAAAGGLQQFTGFGSNPGNLQMYAYTPAGLPAGAPLVVALHGCTQTASAYYTNSGWPKFADTWGFSVVFPQTTSANNSLSCFNWFDPADDTRGRGEAASVVQMVEYAKQTYGSDGRRVYVTGLSAGGGMTADLLAAYPDVFAGGSVASGLPAQCATSQAAASGCQTGPQKLTPAQWGDKVRGAYPGYSGPWPRVAIWQGTSDYTVYPANATALRDQWTNVWGIGQTPSSTDTLPGNTTRSVYDDASGNPAVETYSLSGMGHGLPVSPGSGAQNCGTTAAYFLNTICSAYYTGVFWGLDGGTPGGGGDQLPAPAGVSVTGTTDTTAALSWKAVEGAASYAVHRNGTKIASPTATTYTDTGLTAGTAYRYTVTAIDAEGTAGTASAQVTATTTGGSTPATCYSATNYAHVAAGRAHTSGGYVYANGSDQNMGLYNVFVTHTLKESPAGHFVIADSGCTTG